MRKILMFVGTFAVIFMLAACGNGVQKKTYEKYSAAEVEQAGQVMKYYNTSLALLKNLVLEKGCEFHIGIYGAGRQCADAGNCYSSGFLSEGLCIGCQSRYIF